MSLKLIVPVFVLSLSSAASLASAQEHQHHPAPAGLVDVPLQREGSGTSWMPDATTMAAVHGPTLGGWRSMLHAVAFVQYLRDEEPRGVSQFGSVNWIMGEVRKGAGTGELAFRGMLSLEPWTIRGCGYPNLLASGEVCDGHAIVDRQHPHDLLMELSARYVRPVAEGVALQIYGGLAGEPALGPVAFPHRPSAMVSPIAPIAHHWLDATHLSFGVVTAGLYGQRWKAEGSLFNGREPDDERLGLDLAALDSYSARVTFLPTQPLGFAGVGGTSRGGGGARRRPR